MFSKYLDLMWAQLVIVIPVVPALVSGHLYTKSPHVCSIAMLCGDCVLQQGY